MTSALPDADRIRALLDQSTPFTRIDVVATTGSTNADLTSQARSGEREGAVLIASEQTAGRGRLARTWASPRGSSVSMSVLLAPTAPFPQWGWLSLLAGMAVTSAISDSAPHRDDVSLKWPNDVLVGGRKVCGILSERVEHPTGPRAVIGIGLNVTLSQEELPVPTATSLVLAGLPTDQNQLVAGILNHLARLYGVWRRSGSLRAEYEAQCASVGAPLTIMVDGDSSVQGTGIGVDDLGRLRVSSERGIETFAVGDVVHARLG